MKDRVTSSFSISRFIDAWRVHQRGKTGRTHEIRAALNVCAALQSCEMNELAGSARDEMETLRSTLLETYGDESTMQSELMELQQATAESHDVNMMSENVAFTHLANARVPTVPQQTM